MWLAYNNYLNNTNFAALLAVADAGVASPWSRKSAFFLFLP